ncbi:MAG: 50S ribosomal protein L3 N(5)-glutamine methyltransferase [Gammaproteobacteria bacterium]
MRESGDVSPALLAAAQRELRSIADVIRWGASRFSAAGLCFGHGYDNPVDEATALALHGLHLEPPLAAELFAARLTQEERESVLALFVRRINERIPAAYLMGRAWFAGISLQVDERVLIPRSPIAEWIERGFTPWIEPDQVQRVLDLGTGSGAIAIACALAFPDAEVDAVDVSPGALEVARANIEAVGLQQRVHAIRSDLFSALQGCYDLIVSNPPYVEATLLASLPPEYHHEPRQALVAGEEGLACVRRILQQVGEYLSPAGILVVEVGVSRGALEGAFPDWPFTWLELGRGGENVFLLTAEQLPCPRRSSATAP